MFKSKLQEYCQSKKWNLPEYSTTREGLDHCPQFKATVTVNGSTFTTPNPSKSSKEAHNLVANIAYQHLTGSSANNALQVSPTSIDAQQPKMNEPLQGATVSDVNFSSRDDKKFKGSSPNNALQVSPTSIDAQQTKMNEPLQGATVSDVNFSSRDDKKFKGSSANNALQVSPTSIDAQQPKMNEPLQGATVSDVNFSSRDDKKFKDMSHLYKKQLQIYAQKKNINLPVYISEREGPPHACRFKSKVMLEGKTYESFEFFSTIKDAENAAAKAALASVSSDETEEEDPGFFKNLLQELAQKEYSCLPAYVTTRSGPSHNPIFSSTVEINEESFTGQEAKTKKLAEINAAKVAYIAMKERKGKPNFKPDSPSYHVNDAPPKSQFVPIADLSDKHILAPDPISNRAHMDLVNCNKGLDDLNDQNEVIIYCPEGQRIKRNPDLTGAYHQDTVAEQTGGNLKSTLTLIKIIVD